MKTTCYVDTDVVRHTGTPPFDTEITEKGNLWIEIN